VSKSRLASSLARAEQNNSYSQCCCFDRLAQQEAHTNKIFRKVRITERETLYHLVYFRCRFCLLSFHEEGPRLVYS
jgi:hypothetical protein